MTNKGGHEWCTKVTVGDPGRQTGLQKIGIDQGQLWSMILEEEPPVGLQVQEVCQPRTVPTNCQRAPLPQVKQDSANRDPTANNPTPTLHFQTLPKSIYWLAIVPNKINSVKECLYKNLLKEGRRALLDDWNFRWKKKQTKSLPTACLLTIFYASLQQAPLTSSSQWARGRKSY
jgi:hypothetical protein